MTTTTPTPLTWTAPLDPDELKDYSNTWAAELTATSDTLVTSLFILPSDAIAAGLLIDSQGATATGGVVFFDVNVSDRGSNNWNNSGTQFRIRHQITTIGGRRLEISIMLQVAQK